MLDYYMVTEAQQRASLAYKNRQMLLNADAFKEKQREYARKSFKLYYFANDQYRLNQIKRASDRYYYDNSKDQFLKSVRLLFKN